MEIEQWLRAGLARENPGPDFTLAVMRRVRTLRIAQRGGRGAGRGRFVLIGVLAAVAAAAAMRVLLQFEPQAPAGVTAASSPAQPVILKPEQVRPAGPDARAPAVPALLPPREVVRASPPIDEPAGSVASLVPGDASQAAFTVVLMPLRHEQQDPAARMPVDEFYGALLTGLRNVPGLQLAAPDSPESATALARIWVISLAGESLPQGGVIYRMARAQGSATYNPRAPDIGTFWPLEFTIEQPGKSGLLLGVGIDGVVMLARPDVPRSARCDDAIVPRSMESRCMSPAELAARQVHYLRLRVFPPDPVLHRQMLARVGDRSAAEGHRHAALHEIVSAYKQARGFPPDAEAVRAITSLALDAPALRAQVWSIVRGYVDAGLLEPLLSSLVSDADEGVRVEAMTTLLADYNGDERLRSSLARVAREDSSELVRMLALRAIAGEGAWRDYVLTKLRDGTLTPEQRAAPLRHGSERASGPAERAAMAALVNNGEVIDAVLALAREGRAQTDIMQRAAVRHALNALMRDRDSVAADTRWQEVQSMYAEYAGQRNVPPQPDAPAR